MSTFFKVALVALIATASACSSDKCARHSDCGVGEVCNAGGICAIAPPSTDGGADASTSDAGTTPIDAAADAMDLDAGTDAAIDASPFRVPVSIVGDDIAGP